MGLFENAASGFIISFQPINLVFCFIGVLVGTFTGVLPGFGPVAAIAPLLPLTFGLSPVSSIILLSGIYYGAMYWGVHIFHTGEYTGRGRYRRYVFRGISHGEK